MSKCDERFARQYRYEPPPEFPLASPYSDIVHHLSGPNTSAHTQTFLKDQSRPLVQKSQLLLSLRTSMYIFTYSRMCVDSLVRVSRRVNLNLLRRHRGLTVPRRRIHDERGTCADHSLLKPLVKELRQSAKTVHSIGISCVTL